MKLIISPITTFNEDELLWETKVGLDEIGMPLLYSVYGNTELESRNAAFILVDLLN